MIIENNTHYTDELITQVKSRLATVAKSLAIPLDAIADTVKIGGDFTIAANITAYQLNFSKQKTLLIGIDKQDLLPEDEILKAVVEKKIHVLKKDRKQCIGLEFCGVEQLKAEKVTRQAAELMGLNFDNWVEQVAVFDFDTLPSIFYQGCARNLPQGISLVGADTSDGYDYEASVYADKQVVSLRRELLYKDTIDEYDEHGVCGQRSMCLLLVAMHELVHVVQNKRASMGDKTLPISDDLWRHVVGLQQIYFEEIHAVLASLYYYKRANLPVLSSEVLADEQAYIDKNRRSISGIENAVIEEVIRTIKQSLDEQYDQTLANSH